MIGNKLPQNLLSGLALGVAVGASMLALSYGQYHWLAGELVSSSAAEHEVFLRASFERRMRARLHDMADRVAAATALSRADDSRERTEALKDAIYGLGEKIEGAGHDIGGALDGIAKGVNPDHIEGKVYGSRAEYLASLGEG